MNLPFIWKLTQGIGAGTYIDLATYLLEKRSIFIGPKITSETASLFAMQILALSEQNGPISLYLNSQGGSIPAGLAIVDLINYTNCNAATPVGTYCFGECMGIACAILVSGKKGERRSFPSTRISLYQEWYESNSLLKSLTRDSHEKERVMEILQEIFVQHTNPDQLKPDKLKSFLTEQTILSSTEAIQLGLIDELC